MSPAEEYERLLNLVALDRAPDVMGYLIGRGILTQAVFAGVAALPASHEMPLLLRRLEREGLAGLALEAGICDEHGRPTRPAHRLLIPWRDDVGGVDVIQRRLLSDGEPRYLFPAGKAPGFLYGADGVGGSGPVAIVEGALDALALRRILAERQANVQVVAVPSATVWRPEWNESLRGRDVYVSVDQDAAGSRLAARLTDELTPIASKLKERRPPRKDWGEVLTGGAR